MSLGSSRNAPGASRDEPKIACRNSRPSSGRERRRTAVFVACENSRPSRETPLGPEAKKDGCFRRLLYCFRRLAAKETSEDVTLSDIGYQITD